MKTTSSAVLAGLISIAKASSQSSGTIYSPRAMLSELDTFDEVTFRSLYPNIKLVPTDPHKGD